MDAHLLVKAKWRGTGFKGDVEKIRQCWAEITLNEDGGDQALIEKKTQEIIEEMQKNDTTLNGTGTCVDSTVVYTAKDVKHLNRLFSTNTNLINEIAGISKALRSLSHDEEHQEIRAALIGKIAELTEGIHGLDSSSESDDSK